MNTTELTHKYIREHPSVRDCLDIINYSKLARKIGTELGITKKTSMEAILIACRRFAGSEGNEKKIKKILADSELEIKNKIVVQVVRKDKVPRGSYVIEGSDTYTVITSEKKKSDKYNVIKEKKGLVLVKVKSPKDIEEVPGVLGHMYSLFAHNGINIVETMSCWTDTLFIIDQKDVGKVVELFPSQ